MPENKDLIPLEKVELAKIFADEKSWEKLFAQIKSRVEGIVPDLTTKKGRDEVVARSAWVTKSKTYLDKERKNLTAGLRTEIKTINGLWEKVKTDLSELSEKTREPVTLYEIEEARRKEEDDKRIKAISEQIEGIKEFSPRNGYDVPILASMATAEQLQTAINGLSELVLTETFFQEFFEEAFETQKTRLEVLQSAYDYQKGKEDLAAEQKKLADLKKELEDEKRKLANEKKELESARLKRIESKFDDIREYDWTVPWKYADSVQRRIEDLEKFVVDNSFEEFEDEARELQDGLLKKLKVGLPLAKQADEKKLEAPEAPEAPEIKLKDTKQTFVDVSEPTPEEEELDRIKRINREVISSYVEHGYTKQESIKLMLLIAKGKIKNVTINH